MASKEHCLLCDKPFYGKQKTIRCGVCDSRFHVNCVPNCSPEPSVSATTGKSSYKCANCIKQTGDAADEHSFCNSNQKDAFTTDLLCSASCNGDKDSLSVQLEALRTNGICTMEMVHSIVVMLSNLSSEVKQLRIDNEAMKMQLREFQQAPSHVQPTRREAGTSTSLAAKSYRDVVCAVNGNPSVPKVAAPGINSLPEPSVVTGENPSGASRSGRFAPEESTTSIPYVIGCVCPRSSLDGLEEIRMQVLPIPRTKGGRTASGVVSYASTTAAIERDGGVLIMILTFTEAQCSDLPKNKGNYLMMAHVAETWQKKARIHETRPGRDGKVRTVILRTANGTNVSRPVQLVIPLEIDQGGEDVED
ncbi:hypothetical protein B7P43_G12505 [Cryptotermes secundus]|uniref:PHD-type domain-containing protein n=1 Tax=Cryptotermes secundus TaxID=105785 RepID=A0A2J7PU25_9NEOP|nr:hypothetical protein B7P43_G12505 [Cryptotermes secundus]